MNPIKYLKKNGIKHTLEIVYVYKLEDILERLMYFGDEKYRIERYNYD